MNRPTPTTPPRISFGLPVRNGASTIGKAIESVLAQTFEDWELVISDNESTDGTSESAPLSLRGTSVSAMSRPDAISRSTRTSVQRSTIREARTSAGAETTTGSSLSMRNAPSQRSNRSPGPCSARPSSSTTATAEPCR